jgi:UDP-N-acetylmuramoyl-tripeptide--D-alanyl-D-alanine ligase
MNIDLLYNIFLKYRKVSIDSRTAEKGSIFFALKGDNFDGNKYAQDAIKKGCAIAIVDDTNFANHKKIFKVDNVLKTLQDLSNFHRRKLGIPIIAITGTNGKTTTKELISTVLSSKFKIAFTKGNLNNHIGVPLTLLSMDDKTQIGIVEMGANHLNEIDLLCKIAEPDYGIITNIGRAHLEGFGSYENVIKAKTELYNYIKKKDGIVFYNSNDNLLKSKVNEFELNTFSYGDESSTVKGEILDSDQFLKMNMVIKGEVLELKTQLIGRYNFDNVLAAAIIGNYFKIEPNLIIDSIKKYKPQNNRSQFLKTNTNNIFLDAYNANPSSVNASVQNFLSLKLSEKIIILGDMLELGVDSILEHKKIVELLAKEQIEQIIVVGDIYNSIQVPNNFIQLKNVDELKIWLRENNIKQSNILIKGSRGIGLEKVIELL